MFCHPGAQVEPACMSLLMIPLSVCLSVSEHSCDVHWNGVQRGLHLLVDQLHRPEYQVWRGRWVRVFQAVPPVFWLIF